MYRVIIPFIIFKQSKNFISYIKPTRKVPTHIIFPQNTLATACQSDSSPQIIKNKIRCNFGNGICIRTTNQSGTIKISGNEIYENENGISLKGDNLKAIIDNNPFIGNNRKAGIRLEDFAEADIVSNDIYENLCQGVLLVTQTSANIERNRIYGNLRANVALGIGKTKIFDNKIFKGRCEGIFLFESGGNCQILQNEIYENNDGILAVDASIDIQRNKIYENKRTGITLAGSGECILRVLGFFLLLV